MQMSFDYFMVTYYISNSLIFMNALVLLLAVENIRFKWGLKESFIFKIN